MTDIHHSPVDDVTDISDGQERQLELLRLLFTECEEQGLRIWLFGGWGIDTLLGRITRSHTDIDVLTKSSSRRALRMILEQLGGALCDNGTGWWYNWHDIGVDIGFLLTHRNGTVVSDINKDDPCVYPWPPGSFPEECNGRLPSLTCRAITWEAQYIAKDGYCKAIPDTSLREKDLVDLEIIRRHISPERRIELETWFPGIPREAETGN